MISFISSVLSPLRIDREAFGETGSYVALAARCSPLSFVASIPSYLYLSMKKDANTCEVLEDRLTLLVTINFSALLTMITAVALDALGCVSLFVRGALILGFLAGALFSPCLAPLDRQLTMVRAEQEAMRRLNQAGERLYNEAQQNIRRIGAEMRAQARARFPATS